MWIERSAARGRRPGSPLLALALVLLALAFPAAARPIDPAGQASVLADPSGDLSLADALARRASFRPAADLWGRSGYASQTLWLLIPLRDPPTDTQRAMLRIADGRVSRISAWSIAQGLGDVPTALPLARVPYRFPVFALDPAPAPKALLLRIPPGEPMNFQLALDPDAVGQAWLRRDASIMGAVYGVMCIMIVFHATMLLVMRRLDQVLLLPALVLLLAERLLRDGYAGWLFGLDLPLRPAILGIDASFIALGAWIYVLYLSLPSERPTLVPAWKWLGASGLGLVPLAVFPELAYPALLAGYGLWVLLGLVSGLCMLQRGAIAWFGSGLAAITLVPLTLTLAFDLGLFYPSPLALYTMPLVFMVTLTVIVLAIAHRIDQMRRDALRANRALQAHRRDLEETVARRTADLAAAVERAERSSRAKSDFLAHMSHELRTPLNAVLGYAQILSASGLTPAQERSRGIVERAGRHLLALIDDLLDIARIEAGKLVLRPEPLRLRPFLDDLVAAHRLTAERKGLDLEQEIEAGLPERVRVDGARLRQLLTNLLGNAIKYTDQGWVRLRVSTLREPGRLRFEVEDTGPGIPRSEQGRIFEPFAQGREELRAREGVGLGLAIVRRLVDAMDGRLEFASRLGAGSRFWIELDLPVCPADEDSGAAGTNRPVGYAGARRRLLVVDDLADNRQLLWDLLGGLGFGVDLAESGSEAVARVSAALPDLVLLDIYMPGMDGFAVLEALRALPGAAALPAVAVSASVSAADRSRVVAAGFDGFVPKPVDALALTQTLGALLRIEWIYPARSPAPADDAQTGPIALDAELWAAWQGLGEFPSFNEATALGELLGRRGDARGDARLARAGRELCAVAADFDPERLAQAVAALAGQVRPAGTTAPPVF